MQKLFKKKNKELTYAYIRPPYPLDMDLVQLYRNDFLEKQPLIQEFTKLLGALKQDAQYLELLNDCNCNEYGLFAEEQVEALLIIKKKFIQDYNLIIAFINKNKENSDLQIKLNLLEKIYNENFEYLHEVYNQNQPSIITTNFFYVNATKTYKNYIMEFTEKSFEDKHLCLYLLPETFHLWCFRHILFFQKEQLAIEHIQHISHLQLYTSPYIFREHYMWLFQNLLKKNTNFAKDFEIYRSSIARLTTLQKDLFKKKPTSMELENFFHSEEIHKLIVFKRDFEYTIAFEIFDEFLLWSQIPQQAYIDPEILRCYVFLIRSDKQFNNIFEKEKLLQLQNTNKLTLNIEQLEVLHDSFGIVLFIFCFLVLKTIIFKWKNKK